MIIRAIKNSRAVRKLQRLSSDDVNQGEDMKAATRSHSIAVLTNAVRVARTITWSARNEATTPTGVNQLV